MEPGGPSTASAPIDGLRLGPVRLRVARLEEMRRFYERAIGLDVLDDQAGVIRLGVGGAALVELEEEPDASPRPAGSTGLFHLAILVPNRRALGGAIHRVLDSGWNFTGAADHLVSEAMYLDDPEGNGIELYRDRPRERWTYDSDGALEMATLSLDLHSLLEEPGARDEGPHMPEGTRMGHVHLQVAELEDVETFYAGTLGLDVMVRGYPGALFVAADGYHHHLGLNTWASRRGRPPGPRSRGLVRYEMGIRDEAALDELAGKLSAGGHPVTATGTGVETQDPSGNGILLTADGS